MKADARSRFDNRDADENAQVPECVVCRVGRENCRCVNSPCLVPCWRRAGNVVGAGVPRLLIESPPTLGPANSRSRCRSRPADDQPSELDVDSSMAHSVIERHCQRRRAKCENSSRRPRSASTRRLRWCNPGRCGWGRPDLHTRREVRPLADARARVHANDCAVPSRLTV